jgi:hypothetical protein
MKSYKITNIGTDFRIEGVPKGGRVIAIDSQSATRLADLLLHKADLDFASDCLHAIEKTPARPPVLREALWRSALIHFVKCFGKGARFPLSFRKVYKSESKVTFEALEHLKALRNKHVVHDENAWAQSFPAAVLNDGTRSVEQIVALSVIGHTLTPGNFGNLALAVDKARRWVATHADELCSVIRAELENEDYERLMAMPTIKYRPPSASEAKQKRAR